MKQHVIRLTALALALSLAGCAAPASKPSVPSVAQFPPATSIPMHPRAEALAGEVEQAEAALADGWASISLELPAGWDWELLPGESHAPLRVAFWPEGENGRLTLSFYDSFGVCGTGLTTREVVFDSGRTASLGTYDGGFWSYLVFSDAPGDYVAMPEGAEGWWSKHGDTAMSILGSARLGEGLLIRSEAEAIARSAVEGAYSAVIDWSRFDYRTGQWSVHLSSPNGTPGDDVMVVLDPMGNVLNIQPGE